MKKLTKEEQIDYLLLQGKSYQYIADKLNIGNNTISKRVKFLGPEKMQGRIIRNNFKVTETKNGATTTTYKKAKYNNQFTPEEFDFICDLIIKLSKRPGVLKKSDFKKAMLILAKYQ